MMDRLDRHDRLFAGVDAGMGESLQLGALQPLGRDDDVNAADPQYRRRPQMLDGAAPARPQRHVAAVGNAHDLPGEFQRRAVSRIDLAAEKAALLVLTWVLRG